MRIDELFNDRSIVGGGLLSLGGIIRALDLEGFTVGLFEMIVTGVALMSWVIVAAL